MLIRALRVGVSAVVTLAVCAYLIVTGCDDAPAPSDALGPRDDINECCSEWRPWNTDAPGECLDALAEPGVCRWLDCLLGLYSYHSEACP